MNDINSLRVKLQSSTSPSVNRVPGITTSRSTAGSSTRMPPAPSGTSTPVVRWWYRPLTSFLTVRARRLFVTSVNRSAINVIASTVSMVSSTVILVSSGFLFLSEPRGVPTCGAVGAEDDSSGFAVARDLVLHAVDAEDELVSADAGVVHAHHVEHPERGKEWECEPREGVWPAHVVQERHGDAVRGGSGFDGAVRRVFDDAVFDDAVGDVVHAVIVSVCDAARGRVVDRYSVPHVGVADGVIDAVEVISVNRTVGKRRATRRVNQNKVMTTSAQVPAHAVDQLLHHVPHGCFGWLVRGLHADAWWHGHHQVRPVLRWHQINQLLQHTGHGGGGATKHWKRLKKRVLKGFRDVAGGDTDAAGLHGLIDARVVTKVAGEQWELLLPGLASHDCHATVRSEEWPGVVEWADSPRREARCVRLVRKVELKGHGADHGVTAECSGANAAHITSVDGDAANAAGDVHVGVTPVEGDGHSCLMREWDLHVRRSRANEQ